jgi:putative NADH-flavin reductase
VKVVVFGANGGTGRLVTRSCSMPATPVVAVTRQPATFPISDPRLTVGEVDGVWDADAVANALLGIEPRLF